MSPNDGPKTVIDESNVLISLANLLVNLDIYSTVSASYKLALQQHAENQMQHRNEVLFYEQVLEKLDTIIERVSSVVE